MSRIIVQAPVVSNQAWGLDAALGETFSDDDLSRWCLRLSEPAFANVWDNARDAAYDKL
jgi:hypothetical protein